MWAVLPFKGAAGAKKRLAPALDPQEREGLVLAMVRDVLDALVGSRLLAGVVIVSRAPVAAQLAREFGVEALADTAGDLSGAVVQAGEHVARSRGTTGTLFIPGDVPLVTAREIDTVLDAHTEVTLVPDANDIGTNAAALLAPQRLRIPLRRQELQATHRLRPPRRIRTLHRPPAGVRPRRGHHRRTRRRGRQRTRNPHGRLPRAQRHR